MLTVVALSACCSDDNSRSDDPPPLPPPPQQNWLQWLLLFIVSWSAKYRVSANAVEALFEALRRVFLALGHLSERPGRGKTTYSVMINCNGARWPRTLTDASGPLGININAFEQKLICPDPNCGAVYNRDDVIARNAAGRQSIPRCTRIKSNITEQPRLAEFKARQKALHDGAAHERCNTLLLRSTHRQRKGMQKKKKPILKPPAGPEEPPEDYYCEEEDLEEEHAGDALPPTEPVPLSAEVEADLTDTPLRLYPYVGVLATIRKLRENPEFAKLTERWRERYDDDHKRIEKDLASDIWDGDVWERFQRIAVTFDGEDDHPVKARPIGGSDDSAALHPDEHAFDCLAARGTLMLALNVDWFVSFKGDNYSMGGVYLTILNLPRDQRYLLKNMLLVGILPGPKPTSREQLFGALKPIVSELKPFEIQGARLEPGDLDVTRLVLLNVICDLPAKQSVCGFLSYAANVGCAWCMNAGKGHFAYSQTCPRNASGRFEPLDLRDDAGHRNAGLLWAQATTELEAEQAKASALDQRHRVARGKPRRRPGESSDDSTDEEPDESEHARLHRQRDLYLSAAGNNKKRPEQVRDAMEKWTGSRYSALMDLLLFDTVHGAPLDVMHNIFLGTCKELMVLLTTGKRALVSPVGVAARGGGAAAAAAAAAPAKKHKNEKILLDKHLVFLQTFIDNSPCPRDIGRIPGKITHHLAKFKAAEYNNWMCIFCVPAMLQLYEHPDISMRPPQLTAGMLWLLLWMQKASVILQSYVLSKAQIDEVDQLLLKVLKQVEAIWGAKAITPNLHYHMHLKRMLLDYGPPAGWWCNSYERYNGLLKGVPRNPNFIEICTMRRILLVLGIGQAIDKYSLQAAARQRHGGGQPLAPGAASGPTLEDYQFVDAENVGTREALQYDLEDRKTTWQMVRNSSGHQQMVITYGGKNWANNFRRHQMVANQNPLTPSLGHEPLIGEMVRTVSTATRPLETLISASYKYNDLMNNDHLINCLRRYYGISLFDLIIDAWQPRHDELTVAYALSQLDENTRATIAATMMNKDHAAMSGADRRACTDRVFGLPNLLENASLLARLTRAKLNVESWEVLISQHVPSKKVLIDQLVLLVRNAYKARFDQLNKDEDKLLLIQKLYSVSLLISIYDVLHLQGNTYGAAVSPAQHRRSWVTVTFNDLDGTPRPAYGRVLFFFKHTFAGRVHSLAAMEWYDELTVAQRLKAFPLVSQRDKALQRSLLAAFPVLKRESQISIQDIIPVRSIHGRWVPHRYQRIGSGKLIQVLPLPSSAHA